MSKHRVYKFAGRWIAQCGRCPAVYSTKNQWSAFAVLAEHVDWTCPLTEGHRS